MNDHSHTFPFHDLGLSSGLPAQGSDKDFWTHVRSELVGNNLDFLQGETPEGIRLWLISQGKGSEEAGAMAGLALVRGLASQGRCTLLVDAEESESLLTHRSDRLFCSGWLDMARYGASLTSAALTVDWDGRQGYFLGMGSYCPPEARDTEIKSLLERLQGQVDDVVVVCGSGPEALPWSGVAERRLFCWNSETESPQVRDSALSNWGNMGVPCDGVLIFGRKMATVSHPEPSEGEKTIPSATVESPTKVDQRQAALETHSSRIFRIVALAGLAVVALLAVFIWKYTDMGTESTTRRLGPVDTGSPVAPALAQESPTSVPDTPAAELDSHVVMTDTLVAPAVSEESRPLESEPGSATTDTLAAVVDSVPTIPDPEAEWLAVAPAFSRPVGEQGWCIHVYSLPDSTDARREIHIVQRKGLNAIMAPVILPDSTQWYRVYVGDFSSRVEASGAAEALKWKLRTDWVRPSVLPASARD